LGLPAAGASLRNRCHDSILLERSDLFCYYQSERSVPIERRAASRSERPMDWKLELVAIPVTDVDRAKAFYVDQVGFVDDHDHLVSDDLRFVQLTPPGSACS